MSKGIEGKVVVIAGASSGLGEARRSKGRHALALSAVRALCCRVGRVEHKPHALIQRRVQRRVPGAPGRLSRIWEEATSARGNAPPPSAPRP